MCTVYPVYYVSMLEPTPSSSILNGSEEPPPPVEVNSNLEYKIEVILDSKLDCYHCCKLLYLVCWSGYEGSEDETSWITANKLNHAQELVSDYHLVYLDKPGPHNIEFFLS